MRPPPRKAWPFSFLNYYFSIAHYQPAAARGLLLLLLLLLFCFSS
jgi:hypothetical protein